ncbi:MAG: ABC transporter permease [Pirellulales bacterium]|nr:ABC transporter permease [Pirellulales bacterium]
MHKLADANSEVNDDAPLTAGARRWLRLFAPLVMGAAILATWEAVVRLNNIPPYLLASPSVIAKTIVAEWPTLAPAWLVTLKTMLVALAAAVIVGAAAAALFASSRVLEATLFPYAVMLQVTPLVAVAPFIVLWLNDRVWLAQVLCAWIVAFFPILSNTSIGLRSADVGQRDLFDLYGATRWQKLHMLLAPSALPYFLAGLKISANLALVGAIVGEFVIGPEAEHPGLATTILASQFRQDTPMMFAALAVVSLTGIVVFFLVHLLSYWLLRRWHESALT